MIKIKKLYYNEKGSILFLVIMMTFVLLMLGMTALTISLSSYKMRKAESVVKKNFHLAEAISQEAEMKLDEYIKDYLDNSYEKLVEYIEKNEDKDIKKEQMKKIFNDSFNKQIINLKKQIEDVNNYNLKAIEKYDISVEARLEDLDIQEDIKGYDLYISSSFEEDNIEEKIKIEYRIRLPEYPNETDSHKYSEFIKYKENQNLIRKVNWLNYRW